VPLAAAAAVDVGLGALLGLAFNPLTALIGATLAGALGARSRIGWALVVVLAAWVLGDGVRVIAAIAATVEAAGEGVIAAEVAPLVAWGLVSLGAGYALPAWAGAFAGSRVTHGTGWLAGGAIGAAVCAAIATLGGVLG
jgi:hypothetical protein